VNKIIITSLLILAACTSPEKRLLFSSNRNGNSDIYLMNFNGSDVERVTDSNLEEWGAVWINKDEISFLRQNGKSIKRIKLNLKTKLEEELGHPDICILDDKNALYNISSGDQLFVCDGDLYYQVDQKAINLTENIDGAVNYPSWAPKGDMVIITSNHNGSNDIYSINIKSKELTQLTDNSSNNERGEISPNGQLLVFSTDRYEKGNQDIALINLKTKELSRLTNSKGFDLIARWAGNNEDLFIGSNKDGNWEIYSLNIKANKLVRLTNNDSFDGDPRIHK